MALKNVNVFEQHVEKIVLAVAVAGAAFMAFMALQPVTLPDNAEVGPKNVEEEIGKEIRRLEAKKDALPAPQPVVPDLVGRYHEMASGQPLDAALVNAKPPEFGPRNLAPKKIDGVQGESFASVVPDPVKPEMLHAQALQLQVYTSLKDPDKGQPIVPGQPVTVPAGQQLTPIVTKNVVAIDGYIPVGKFLLDLLSEKEARKRFTPDVQKGMVYRIRVFRQELLPNGAYSKPALVTPAQGSPAPTDVLPTTMPEGGLAARISDIDAQFQIIQLPNYYVDPQGQPVQPPILSRPLPQAIVDETAKLHNDIQAAQANAAAAAAGGFKPNPPAGGGVAAGAAAGPATLPSAPDSIKALEVQPFTFWDDSVTPGHTYKYSVQVQLVNPAFGWKWGLANASLKLEPVLPLKNDGIVAVPDTVVIHTDLDFFIQGNDSMAGRGITGYIFKQVAGRWYSGNFSADRGKNIQTTMNAGGATAEEVDTKFTVVDCWDGRSSDKRVVLRDPSGNLVIRSLPDDWNQQERKDLQDKVIKDREAVTTAAATSTAPAGTGTPATTPSRTNPPGSMPASRPRGPAVNPGH